MKRRIRTFQTASYIFRISSFIIVAGRQFHVIINEQRDFILSFKTLFFFSKMKRKRFSGKSQQTIISSFWKNVLFAFSQRCKWNEKRKLRCLCLFKNWSDKQHFLFESGRTIIFLATIWGILLWNFYTLRIFLNKFRYKSLAYITYVLYNVIV